MKDDERRLYKHMQYKIVLLLYCKMDIYMDLHKNDFRTKRILAPHQRYWQWQQYVKIKPPQLKYNIKRTLMGIAVKMI